MSLINQVLKDLEKRQGTQLDDVHDGFEKVDVVPTGLTAERRRPVRLITGLVVLLAAVIVTASLYMIEPLQNRVLAMFESQPTKNDTIKQPATAVQETIEETATVIKAQRVEPVAPGAAPKQIAAAKQTHVAKSGSDIQMKTAVKDETVVQSRKQSEARFSRQPAIVTEQVDSTESVTKKIIPMSAQQRAEQAYQDGYAALQAKQFRKAELALNSALVLEPGHIKARELLVGLYVQQGRWVEASKWLADGVERHPTHHTFVKLYARTLMQMKRDQQAIQLLTRSMPSARQDPDHYAILAALYQRQQNHQAAARTYSEILKVRPKMGIWWIGMGISLEAMGQHADASRAYQQAKDSGTLQGDLARYTDNRLLALGAIDYPID